jgi:hypothetical protein
MRRRRIRGFLDASRSFSVAECPDTHVFRGESGACVDLHSIRTDAGHGWSADAAAKRSLPASAFERTIVVPGLPRLRSVTLSISGMRVRLSGKTFSSRETM